MKRFSVLVVALVALAMATELVIAQQEEGRSDEDRPRRERQRSGDRGDRRDRGGRSRGEFRRPPSPIVTALDADEDGVISAKEIENAVAALKKLDKNNDGKLTEEEYAPQRRGGFGGGRDFVARLMENDKNKDGILSKDEIPERMRRFVERADTNNDGTLDKKELEAMSERGNRRGGRGGRRGGREGGRGRQQRPDSE